MGDIFYAISFNMFHTSLKTKLILMLLTTLLNLCVSFDTHIYMLYTYYELKCMVYIKGSNVVNGTTIGWNI